MHPEFPREKKLMHAIFHQFDEIFVSIKNCFQKLCIVNHVTIIFALSMFFTEQRDNFQISCHLIGWKSLFPWDFFENCLIYKITVAETKFQ